MLRTEAGRDPYDRDLSDLIGELSTRSDDFRIRWAAHDVKLHRTGLKHLRHPVVGDIHLSYEVLDLRPIPDCRSSPSAHRRVHQPTKRSESSPAGQQPTWNRHDAQHESGLNSALRLASDTAQRQADSKVAHITIR